MKKRPGFFVIRVKNSIIIHSMFSISCLLIFVGCDNKEIPEIQTGLDTCSHCQMVISQLNQACGYFYKNEFVTFCSPGCLLNDYENYRKEGVVNPQKIYFVDFVSKEFIHADSTKFLLTNSLPTVMNSGVLCFTSEQIAKTFKRQDNELITDWLGYRIQRGTPDEVLNIVITSEGITPDVIVLSKNQIVEWIFQANDLKKTFEFYLKGYESMGNIILDEKIRIVRTRMLSDKPGAGFPFINVEDDKPLGMLKVMGSHTQDEEVM
jgi:hypothetical protein